MDNKELNHEQELRDKIADDFKRREENMKTMAGVAKEFNQVVEAKHGADPTVGLVVVGVAAAKIGKDLYDDFQKKISEKDSGKEWETAIIKRETELKERHTNSINNLEQNKAMQESQLRDSKKDGYEGKLKELDNLAEKSRQELNDKLARDMKLIEDQKQARQTALDSTKDMAPKERNEEIERQRKEYDRQRELDRNR